MNEPPAISMARLAQLEQIYAIRYQRALIRGAHPSTIGLLAERGADGKIVYETPDGGSGNAVDLSNSSATPIGSVIPSVTRGASGGYIQARPS